MIPSSLLKNLYSFGSLESGERGTSFALKNRIRDAVLTRLGHVRINANEIPLDRLVLEIGDGDRRPASEVTPDRPIAFPLRQTLRVHAGSEVLGRGRHEIALAFETEPFGRLAFTVHDVLGEPEAARPRTPRSKANNYDLEIVRHRRQFIEKTTGIRLEHVDKHSFDPELARGNIENFIGVAQVPLGLAGPLLVRGEHADGEFLIPMATTEGALVASYDRGIKVLNLAGGVRCTVAADRMQRAPVFVFDSAKEARAFRDWVSERIDSIRSAAEATSRYAKLLHVETYLAHKFAYLRFNYETGDAAGQNMVGKATFAACNWILDRSDTVRRFYLESNLATDKKASLVNVMQSRGKRVTAEATIPRQVLERHLRVDPETLHHHNDVATQGAFLAGANNNGAHSPNGITAMFIATGQDVANVAEGTAGILYSEVTSDGDFYVSLTIPSLIVATTGGGTGLPTQRECLEVLGCRGAGKARKLAEIIAGVALAGELSLGAAISSMDWVASHEAFGRKRVDP